MSSKSFSLRMADILAVCHLTNKSHSKSRYVFTKGSFIACSQCCYIYRERFATLDNWIIKTDQVNKYDRFLNCDVCGERIPPRISVKKIINSRNFPVKY
jgi:hypothetical protein